MLLLLINIIKVSAAAAAATATTTTTTTTTTGKTFTGTTFYNFLLLHSVKILMDLTLRSQNPMSLEKKKY